MKLLVVAALSCIVGGFFGWVLSRFLVFLAFGPSRQFHAFGKRLPLTPGLWLRHRDSVAALLGGLFARELDTGDALRERLRAERTRTDLEGGIFTRLSALLERPIGELLAEAGRGGDSVPLRLADKALGRILSSPELERALEAAFGEAVALVKDLPLSILLPPDRARSMTSSFFSETSLKALANRIDAAIDGGLPTRERASVGGLPVVSEAGVDAEPFVAGLVPARALSPLIGLVVDALYDAAIPVVESMLNDSDTRRTVEVGANEMVRRAIARLGVVQRLIVGAANYERSLAEAMPETVEDLVSMVSSILRSPSTRERAREAALEGWESGDSGGRGIVARLGSKLSRDALWRALSAVLGQLVDEGPSVADRVAALAASAGNVSIGSLLAAWGFEGDVEGATGVVDLAGLFDSERGAGKALARARKVFVDSFLRSFSDRSLATALDLDETSTKSLSSWLAGASIAALDAEADSIVAGLDIGELVIEKLRSIDNSEARKLVDPALRKIAGVLVLAFAAIGFLGGIFDSTIFKMLGG